MLKKLFAISLIFITATEINAMTFENKIAVKHGLFGILPVVDHRADIRAYNNWCKSQNQSSDNLDFLATTCADMCFKFEENSPDHFSRAEAEDLLIAISKNPVAASAMKVLISKYVKYNKLSDVLPKCELKKEYEERSFYNHDRLAYRENVGWYLGQHSINLHIGDKRPLTLFNTDINESQVYGELRTKRIMTHEMMHLMDHVQMLDMVRLEKEQPIFKETIDFLDSVTILKTSNNYNSVNVKEVSLQLNKVGTSIEKALHNIFDNTVEMYGMYGLKTKSHSFSSEFIDDDSDDIITLHNYELNYEPINDAMSCLYGFDTSDNMTGKIRTSHSRDPEFLTNLPTIAPILEEHFHIYSFYKQKDVLEAFKFSTTVVEEA